MKTITLCKPFGNIKSYSICLDDSDNATLTPLIYLQKSSFLDDDAYTNLVLAIQMKVAQSYLPAIKEKA
jgi:hypothetical protein